MIFDELETRGIKDVLLTCCDNLKGISKTLKAVFPNVDIQKWVIHQIRNSTKHVSPKDVASFTSNMKKIYKSPSYDATFKVLDSFEKSWGEKYPYAIKSWKNNFDGLV
ncbi:transposase [Malacoplasma iowae]|uniref:Mutator family transposase n=1 Tax=Malacoplasma iowae 695 TaxID=1048830 RepID=A0A6P1LEA3_MALIO|nr:transposase [Malacoplasma iowae]VEU62434.1 Transposase and inactivated derivatives [Mycoplasmopsis fermentans]EGZ31429.1 transposase, mutator type [Malacoplasma iowae 695]QHG89758.1 transposase [Malacoplasma iowae 695]WPL35442.1 transposase [Malacoplasma iowae]VEU72300.1 Transposase and inactivated derivatives [Malacoplasma iowae]